MDYIDSMDIRHHEKCRCTTCNKNEKRGLEDLGEGEEKLEVNPTTGRTNFEDNLVKLLEARRSHLRQRRG